MTEKERIVIIGATSAIAEGCARLWAQNTPSEIILVGRDLRRTERVACDLRVRSPNTHIRSIEMDFSDPLKIQALAKDLCTSLPVDIVLIAHGWLPNQEQCQSNLVENQKALQINGISPVLFAEAFAPHLQKANKGALVVIGSVAGDRGRKSNYIYGSAKGLVERYIQGLQHRLANTNVKVVLVKPGPTDTPMTSHLKEAGAKLSSVETVAKCLVSGVNKGSNIIYAPRKWAVIMLIIRHIPNFIFKRINI